MNVQWQWCSFSELDTSTLYALLQARQQVFVVEQKCLYLDVDGRDAEAWHLMGWDGDAQPQTPRLAAYLRALPPGTRFAEPSIGRVITTMPYRARRLGHALMARGIEHTLATFGPQPLRIFAQSHLQGFYQKHGFIGDGAEYPEDNIMHREMVRPHPLS